ncbi:MAG: hypothetical protein QM733_19495 [Ilumatobacteraceae bacterium]
MWLVVVDRPGRHDEPAGDDRRADHDGHAADDRRGTTTSAPTTTVAATTTTTTAAPRSPDEITAAFHAPATLASVPLMPTDMAKSGSEPMHAALLASPQCAATADILTPFTDAATFYQRTSPANQLGQYFIVRLDAGTPEDAAAEFAVAVAQSPALASCQSVAMQAFFPGPATQCTASVAPALSDLPVDVQWDRMNCTATGVASSNFDALTLHAPGAVVRVASFNLTVDDMTAATTA